MAKTRSIMSVKTIKLERDKHGDKTATIELATLIVDDNPVMDHMPLGVQAGYQSVRTTKKVQTAELSLESGRMGLEFYMAPDIAHVSDFVSGVRFKKFKFIREVEDSEIITMLFRFTVTLVAARKFLIPSIGDTLWIVVVPEASLPFGSDAPEKAPKAAKKKQAPKRPAKGSSKARVS
jgi:hypothetical protein